MTWYRVNVMVGQARQVLEVRADTASVTLFGALVLKSGEVAVAHFRRGQWGGYWEVGALRAEPLADSAAATKDGERPAPPRIKGPFTPREKPVLP